MAWRVTSVPAVSRVMDSGPCSHSRTTSPRRVRSPSAPNKGAEAVRARIPLLRGMREVFLDELGLMGPSPFVGGESLSAASQWDAVETRFGDGQQRATLHRLQLKDHQRGRLAGTVHGGIDGEGVPPKGKETHRLQAIP